MGEIGAPPGLDTTPAGYVVTTMPGCAQTWTEIVALTSTAVSRRIAIAKEQIAGLARSCCWAAVRLGLAGCARGWLTAEGRGRAVAESEMRRPGWLSVCQP